MQNPLTSSLRFVNFVVGWTAERQLAWYSHAAALRKAKRRTAYAVVDADVLQFVWNRLLRFRRQDPNFPMQ